MRLRLIPAVSVALNGPAGRLAIDLLKVSRVFKFSFTDRLRLV